jgi:hypothetical protein
MAAPVASDRLETVLAVRGLPLTHRAIRPPSPRADAQLSDLELVLDTETRVDHSQRFLFGSARLYAVGEYLAEWLYYPPDLTPAEQVLPLDTRCDTRPIPVSHMLRTRPRQSVP